MHAPASAFQTFEIFPRNRRSTLVSDEVRRQLLAGELKVGDKLPTEDVLCKRYGVSRTTLREAMQNLRSAGFIEITPGRGSYVRKPNMADLGNNLALAARLICGQNTFPHASELTATILAECIMLAIKAPAPQRQTLLAFKLNIADSAQKNTATEQRWLGHIARVAGHPVAEVMLSALHVLHVQSRTASQADDERVRTTHLTNQVMLRVNTAICEGQAELATRTLTTFLTAKREHNIPMVA
jgi:DNA-binding FadR family transcriptional regulator